VALIVQKYGGTSVGDLDRIRNVAQRVVRRIKDRVPKEYAPTDREGSVTWHYDVTQLPLDTGSWTLMCRINSYVNSMAKQIEEMGYYYSVKGKPPITKEQAAAIQTWRDLAAAKLSSCTGFGTCTRQCPSRGTRRL